MTWPAPGAVPLAAAAPVTSGQLLGYPAQARLLIVNCDDLGMCRAVNVAVLDSLDRGIAGSTSLMVPCPAASDAVEALRARPHIPFGIHLTICCESPHRRWGPVSPRETVPSLLDANGNLFTPAQRTELLAAARIEEVEREFRAQLRTVDDAALAPTHLDFHCLADGGRPDIFELTLALAAEYGLAVRVWLQPARRDLNRRGFPVIDHDFVDSYRIDGDVDRKSARYAEMLHELPAGLTEWAVHPGVGDDELRAVEPVGWRVRQADHAFLTSTRARDLLRQEGITVIDYRTLQRAWARARAGAHGVVDPSPSGRTPRVDGG